MQSQAAMDLCARCGRVLAPRARQCAACGAAAPARLHKERFAPRLPAAVPRAGFHVGRREAVWMAAGVAFVLLSAALLGYLTRPPVGAGDAVVLARDRLVELEAGRTLWNQFELFQPARIYSVVEEAIQGSFDFCVVPTESGERPPGPGVSACGRAVGSGSGVAAGRYALAIQCSAGGPCSLRYSLWYEPLRGG